MSPTATEKLINVSLIVFGQQWSSILLVDQLIVVFGLHMRFADKKNSSFKWVVSIGSDSHHD